MIDANRGTSPDVLRRLKNESHERLRLQFFDAVQGKLDEFEMTWDDLAHRLSWTHNEIPEVDGFTLTSLVGVDRNLTMEDLNDIAHVFSAEAYVIFRPRKPWILT